MIESYDEFKTEYDHLETSFSLLLKDKNPKDQESYLIELKNLFQDTENLVKNFEFEIHSGSVIVPGDKSKDFKAKKKNVRKMKQQFLEKENYLNDLSIHGMVDEENGDFDEETHSQRMKTKYHFDRAVKSIEKGVDYANNINENMFVMKEKLLNSIETSKQVRGESSLSLSLIGSIERLRSKQKFIFYLVVGVVGIGIVLIMLHRLFKK